MVVLFSADGAVVEVGGPGVGVAGVVGEIADGVAQVFVAGPAKPEERILPDWRVEGATPARQSSASGVGNRARQFPISAKSRAARMVPERGRLVKMCASAWVANCAPICLSSVLICSTTVVSVATNAG